MVVGLWSSWVARRYGQPSGADRILRVATIDAVDLAVKVFDAGGVARHLPVVCLPGLGTDSTNFDAPRPYGLARRFADAGFPTFVVDLRGTGASPMPAGRQNDVTFDDFLDRDLPAVLDRVKALTGARRVALVGHSLGGTLAYAAAARYPDRVATVVAIAAPLSFGDDFPLKALVDRLGPVMDRLPALMGGRLGRLTAPLAFRVDVPLLEHWVVRDNIDAHVGRRMLYAAAQDVPSALVRQLAGWIARDTITSLDGVDHRAALRGLPTPTLVVEAPLDGLAPPRAVRVALDLLPHAEHLIAGRATGCTVDYGHIDVVFGRTAPVEVHPRLVDFLRRQAEAPGEVQ